MINLVTDRKVWTVNQIRKRQEAFNAQIQKHGDEQLLARVNDALLLEILPESYDATGAIKYRDEQYMPRALSAAAMARQAIEDNNHLATLIDIQSALRVFKTTTLLLESDEAPAEIIQDETGADIPNPSHVTATESHAAALAILIAVSIDDWQLVAQRFAGALIAAADELTLAVVEIIPTINILNDFIESSTIHSVDKRKTLVNAKQLLRDILDPVEPEPEVIL
ncbi:MAG: hypothetical protein MJK10_03775 [Pseudomonadales bacterium]|nr:hypothetical protein [Pseudomonadales bacterium]NRA15190.1 hypothetical protein [Oceanospirillaceae bacterium]